MARRFMTAFLRLPEWIVAPQRALNRAAKTAFKACVAKWHKEYLQFHFSMAAYTRYPDVYKMRHGRRRYMDPASGQWRLPDRRPLYESGGTMRQALQAITVHGTSHGASGTFTVPSYITALQRRGYYEPFREMVEMNHQEVAVLCKHLADVTLEELEKDGHKVEVRG